MLFYNFYVLLANMVFLPPYLLIEVFGMLQVHQGVGIKLQF